MRQAAEGTMQLVIVSNGLRVFSRGTTDGNALRNTLGLFGADETVRSLCRDELMTEVGGGMEEDAGRGGDPSIGRKGYTRTLPLTLFRIMFQYVPSKGKEISGRPF